MYVFICCTKFIYIFNIKLWLNNNINIFKFVIFILKQILN
jgi:hypothetical protein